MKPTIGRIVHFYTTVGQAPFGMNVGPHAAIVTGVNADGTVDLTVFPAGGMPPVGVGNIRDQEGVTTATRYWTWPPRDAS